MKITFNKSERAPKPAIGDRVKMCKTGVIEFKIEENHAYKEVSIIYYYKIKEQLYLNLEI